MKFFLIVCVVLSIVFAGCIIIRQTATLPPPPYSGSVPLTGQIIHSPDGDMIATIPEGWILLDTENKTEPDKILVLVDTAYSGIIFFEKFTTTPELTADIQQDGIEVAARKSFARLQTKTHGAATLFSSYLTFGVDDRAFCSYEYTTDHKRTKNRVVVFSAGKQIYECVAAQISTDEKAMMPFADLCTSQQSVVNSIRW